MPYHMVFDVESIGFYGEAFAVGYVVLDEDLTIVQEEMFACDPKNAIGTHEGHKWVEAFVPRLKTNCASTGELRLAFWAKYQILKKTYPDLSLWADCAWPVESNFLMACVEDDIIENGFKGPYPLHEIATLALAKGCDPVFVYTRLPDELPVHNPLNDARQSARILKNLLSVNTTL